jgi:hypothetical protein
MNKHFVYLNGKAIGWLENQEFFTPKRQEHIMKKFGNSFGMNVETLHELKKLAIVMINFLFERGDGKIDRYIGTVTLFFDSPYEFYWNGEHQKFVQMRDLKIVAAPVERTVGLEAFFHEQS